MELPGDSPALLSASIRGPHWLSHGHPSKINLLAPRAWTCPHFKCACPHGLGMSCAMGLHSTPHPSCILMSCLRWCRWYCCLKQGNISKKSLESINLLGQALLGDDGKVSGLQECTCRACRGSSHTLCRVICANTCRIFICQNKRGDYLTLILDVLDAKGAHESSVDVACVAANEVRFATHPACVLILISHIPGLIPLPSYRCAFRAASTAASLKRIFGIEP